MNLSDLTPRQYLTLQELWFMDQALFPWRCSALLMLWWILGEVEIPNVRQYEEIMLPSAKIYQLNEFRGKL